MKRLILTATILALATTAHALTLADLNVLTVAIDNSTGRYTKYLALSCPPNVWTMKPDRRSVVCCNGYKTDDGIADGSCVTRTILP